MARLTSLENRLARDRSGQAAAHLTATLEAERTRLAALLPTLEDEAARQRVVALIEAIDTTREVIGVLSARYAKRRDAKSA